MYSSNKSRPKPGFIARYRHLKWPLLFVVLFLLGGLVYFLVMGQADSETADQPSAGVSETSEPASEEPEPQISTLPSMQAELDAVLPTVSGEHAVLLEDPTTGDVLAAHREDASYFTASIYKLYVAYLGLVDIQNDATEPDELYNQGRTRQQCIIEMIRESDSPCAEQMWAEQGKAASTERLASSFGFEHTSMEALTTTVHDANIIMKRLQQQKDLNDDNTQLLREALGDQIYREAIPSAVPETKVYNKVGFYETGWLDVAIIELPSGREVVLSIFSDAASYPEVRAITEAIVAPLFEE